MQEKLDQMRRRAVRHVDGTGYQTTIPRLILGKADRPSLPMNAMYEPIACLVLQGAKQVTIGSRTLRYDPACYFVASLELPVSGCVIEASADAPYVAAGLFLDRRILIEMLADVPCQKDEDIPGFGVTPITPDLLDAWANLLALLDSPADIPVLAPLRERELLYRLLQGGYGGMLRQIAREDSRLSQITRTIRWIQVHFDEPLRIEQLAEIAGMSVPSFHRHFKAATAMSPLQYQKSIRLQAARRMLAASMEASRAAYSVGYESASQFSREYARMFGAPPSRDAERLRGEAAAA